MKRKIEEIKKIFDEQIEANKALREYEINLDLEGAYSAEYKKKLKQKAKDDHFSLASARKEKILKAVEDLRNMEKTVIDLEDVQLNNAVTLITSLGDAIPNYTLWDIENKFRGNQAGLKVLKGAYEKIGLYTGRIEEYSYDVNSTYNELAQVIFDSFKDPQYVSSLNDALVILNHIESVCEPIPQERATLKFNTLPTMI